MLTPRIGAARLSGPPVALKRANRALGDLRLFQGFGDLKLNLDHADMYQQNWLRGHDLNVRPSGYEPDELPGCSTPRQEINRPYFAGLAFWGGFYLY